MKKISRLMLGMTGGRQSESGNRDGGIGASAHGSLPNGSCLLHSTIGQQARQAFRASPAAVQPCARCRAAIRRKALAVLSGSA